MGHGVNLPLTLGALAFAVYASRAGAYELRLLSVAGAYAILVIGYQFIFSYAGAASLAQSCFFGLGAYVTGVLGATYGFGSEITLPLSILAPGLLAAAVAGAVLRLEDHYFSLATLAITLLVTLVVTQWLSVTGGTNGLSGIPSFSLFGQTVASRYDTMLLVWGFVVAAALLALLILRGLYGRAFHLMRQSRPVASALGLDTARMRFSAFVLSGCYGGLAGALTAHVTHVISPEQVGLPLMITCLDHDGDRRPSVGRGRHPGRAADHLSPGAVSLPRILCLHRLWRSDADVPDPRAQRHRGFAGGHPQPAAADDGRSHRRTDRRRGAR